MRLVVKKIAPVWLDRVLAEAKHWEIRRADDWTWRPGDWLVLAGWDDAWLPHAALVRVQEALSGVPGLRIGYRLLVISPPVARLALPPGALRHDDASARYHWRLAAEAAMGWGGRWDQTNAPRPEPEARP
ncbi:protein of unknown function [Candidatus Hydrogenisulfobacillus filiaventi]|uniref:DUF3850 domain-containing protein n=1 Tax=Candidatus Hydrogenisulfobacillus filiaventi TaxID=2707344 RepID=A0A6F8ZIJ1_9FIRM|nr:protein of unknown function [Candidatus Hydrogenisulfobacillus filiaventi]